MVKAGFASAERFTGCRTRAAPGPPVLLLQYFYGLDEYVVAAESAGFGDNFEPFPAPAPQFAHRDAWRHFAGHFEAGGPEGGAYGHGNVAAGEHQAAE
jgi:hypothetical protein